MTRVQELQYEAELDSLARKALLVDEDAQDLADLAALFEARGFIVVRCRAYEEAMRAIRNELFDFAIVDQGSPAFEGRIVVRCLNQFLPYTVFLVTARCADIKCYLEALKLGAEDYILKPISDKQADFLIQRLLGTRAAA
jgi:ActR/RegA family two-component response regulator